MYFLFAIQISKHNGLQVWKPLNICPDGFRISVIIISTGKLDLIVTSFVEGEGCGSTWDKSSLTPRHWRPHHLHRAMVKGRKKVNVNALNHSAVRTVSRLWRETAGSQCQAIHHSAIRAGSRLRRDTTSSKWHALDHSAIRAGPRLWQEVAGSQCQSLDQHQCHALDHSAIRAGPRLRWEIAGSQCLAIDHSAIGTDL